MFLGNKDIINLEVSKETLVKHCRFDRCFNEEINTNAALCTQVFASKIL